MNEIFKKEWELYQQAGSRSAFRGVEPKPGTTTFDAPVKVGEIRVFADMNRPFVALVLETKGAFGYRLVPVSPFTVPASARELLVGERVFQLWNASTVAKTFVERSWLVETLDAADLADLKAALVLIPSGVQSEDETAREYERAFRVAGGDFRFLAEAPKTSAAWWRGRTGWSIAAMLLLCGGIGGLWYEDVLRNRRADAVMAKAARMEAFRKTIDPANVALEEECEIAVEDAKPAVDVRVDFPTLPAPCAQLACERAAAKRKSVDSVALIRSPVTMRSMCGSQAPGAVGCMVRGGVDNGCAMRTSIAPMPHGEKYAEAEENEFLNPMESPLSTFGLDVDTSSYTLMRSSLVDYKRLPDKDSVRIEEYVNYFKYEYSSSAAGTPRRQDEPPVAVACELAACPWNAAHKLLRLGVQAKTVDEAKLPPCNLTFLVDVSGSMSGEDRIELLKQSLKMLVGKLRDEDHVAIVTYANNTQVRLPSVSGREKKAIGEVIDGLVASGGTAGGEGLELAYKEAQKNFDKKANNRVILVTDGDFNIGISSPKELEAFISQKRDSGIFLTVFGVGRGNYMDANMKKLANAGNGNYAYLDSILEAKKVMLNEFGGTLMTVAKDVKVQVEFNPSEVEGYRLLGYENRKLAARDFNDDKKDAGEIGAGHTMTAFYEIVPAGSGEKVGGTDPLKYQKRAESGTGELCTVKLRYKLPDANKSTLVEEAHKAADITLKEPSEDFRFASAVAEFALLLKDSKYKGAASFTNLIERARDAKGNDREGYRAEFIRLAERAEALAERRVDVSKNGAYCRDDFGDVHTEGAILRTLLEFKSTQAADGSWGTNAAAETAWVVLSYLSHGETADSREFGETVRKGVEFLIGRVAAKTVGPSSLPVVAYALAEAYAIMRHLEARAAAETALAQLAGQPVADPFDAVVRYQAFRAFRLARTKTRVDLDGEMARLAQGWRTGESKGASVAFSCLGLMLEDGATNGQVVAALQEMRNWVPGTQEPEVDWAAGLCKYRAGRCAEATPEDAGAWQRWNKAMKEALPRRLAGVSDLRTKCLGLLQLMVYYRYLPTTQVSCPCKPQPEKKPRRPSVQVDVDI